MGEKNRERNRGEKRNLKKRVRGGGKASLFTLSSNKVQVLDNKEVNIPEEIGLGVLDTHQ